LYTRKILIVLTLLMLSSPSNLFAKVDYYIVNLLEKEPAVKKVSLWENEYGDGILIQTKHYNIYTTLFESLMVRQVPGFLESAHKAYQEIMPEMTDTKHPLKVYLFATREQWEVFTQRFTGEQWQLYKKIDRGAYYLNGSCVAYNIGRRSTFSVLGHEGWHQYASRHFAYRLPSWIDEGLAMHFENYRRENGWFKFDATKNLGRLGGLRVAIENKKFYSVAQLISMNPGHVVGGGEDVVVGYYSQVYALVRFFREYNYGVFREAFERILSDGLSGNWPLSKASAEIVSNRNIPQTVAWNAQLSGHLFKKYLGETSRFEQQYRMYCMSLASRVSLK